MIRSVTCLSTLLLVCFIGNAQVVLELYTSQGCSSCPSADKVFTKIDEKGDDSIIQLAFHVDYWDRLGWKDVFGSPEYSKRQREYAKRLETQNVYTPQIIVNGEEHFVGSHELKILEAINSSNEINKEVIITGFSIEKKDHQLSLGIKLEGKYMGSIISVAIVEDGLETKILRGENAGKTLEYNNVVRQFMTRKSAELNKFSFEPSGEIDLNNARIVVIVQDVNSYRILSAGSYNYPSS